MSEEKKSSPVSDEDQTPQRPLTEKESEREKEREAREEKRQEKLDALEQNDKKKNGIYKGIIIVLIIFFLVGIFWGARRMLMTEGSDPPEDAYKQSATKLQSGGDMITYFKKVLAGTQDDTQTKLKISTSLSVDSDTVKVSGGDEALQDNIKRLLDDDDDGDLLKGLEDRFFPESETKFGEELTNIPASFVLSRLKAAPTCSEGRLDTDKDSDTYNKYIDTDNYYIEFSFGQSEFPPASDSALSTSFAHYDYQTFLNELSSLFEDDLSIDSCDITCSDFHIDVLSNRLTDELQRINYVRGYTVNARVTFQGDLADEGSADISFTLTANTEYAYTWAGFYLKSDRVELEKGKNEKLDAVKTLNEGDEVTVSWTSSDESTATVDKEGYVKGIKTSAQPVTVTATMEYMGHTYTKTCTVYVTKPVTRVDISDKKLEIGVGESTVLTAAVSPKRATIQTVKWYSEDESIAAIDENGRVTGVSSGTVVVYALSDDGYYKTTCTVTVD